MDKKTEEEALNLIETASLINKSVVWWEKKMVYAMQKADRVTESTPLKEIKKIEKELNLLIAKGEMEIKNLDKWFIEKEIIEKKLNKKKKKN